MRAAQMFPAPRSAAAKRVRKLATRRDELAVEKRDAIEAAKASEVALTGARQALLDAEARDHAFGDSASAVKSARRDVERLEKSLTAATDHQRLVTGAVEAVDTELTTFIAERQAELWAEVREDATTQAERVAAATQEIAGAYEEYRRTGVRATELLRATNPEALRSSRVPELPSVYAELTRLSGQPVPPPLPAPIGGGVSGVPVDPVAEAVKTP